MSLMTIVSCTSTGSLISVLFILAVLPLVRNIDMTLRSIDYSGWARMLMSKVSESLFLIVSHNYPCFLCLV